MRSGFASFELAIVMGFLFIVAAVLVFFINPVEQARVKHDERLTNDAQKVVDALANFYIANGRLPWAKLVNTQELSPALAWKPLRSPEVGVCSDETCKEPGELAKRGLLTADFAQTDSVLGRNGVIFLGKAAGTKAGLFACFVPISNNLRSKNGELYRINIDQSFPATGILNGCPSNITWGEDDVCYRCVQK